MPFESEAQRRWMFANHPQMAHEWAAHTPKGKKLPARVGKKKRAKKASAGGWLPDLAERVAELIRRAPD